MCIRTGIYKSIMCYATISNNEVLVIDHSVKMIEKVRMVNNNYIKTIVLSKFTSIKAQKIKFIIVLDIC